MATQVPPEYTECEEYAGHVIAVHNGHYRSFRGYGELARTRPCATREECRRAVDRYNEQEEQYHRSTGHW